MVLRIASFASTKQQKRSTTSRVWLAVATVLCIHILCWKAAQPIRSLHSRRLSPIQPLQPLSLHKRAIASTPTSPSPGLAAGPSLDAGTSYYDDDDDEAIPPPWSKAPLPNEDEEEDSASLIDWMGLWANASKKAKPALFAGMVLWLIFLFAFVGITASDFFCPNLSTIATRLGMSESVAGVTFLAFSNGSPDVFSTFAALKNNVGSLAIGELIGAASFIVSVVAGTMCVIQPFKVARHTFLRDVGFFTVAVTFTLAILYDSHIHGWEAIAMVMLYLSYVAVVAVGSWWISRRERQAEVVRKARSEYAEEQFRDDLSVPPPTGRSSRRSSIAPPSSGSVTPTSPNSYPFPAIPSPSLHPHPHPHIHQSLDEDTLVSLAERGTPVTITRQRSSSVATTAHSPLGRRPKTRSTVRPSLLGAIEFRDVVNSLRQDSSARTLAVFGSAGDEGHAHAAVVGPEGYFNHHYQTQAGVLATPEEGVVKNTARRGHGRSASHAGVMRSDFSSGFTPVRSDALRDSVSSLDSTPTGDLLGGRGPWDTREVDEEGEGGEGPLIDLSAGVENPWRSLKVDIPPFSSTAATSSLRRKASAVSLNASGGPGAPKSAVPSIMLTTEAGAESRLTSDTASVKRGGGRGKVTRLLAFRHSQGYLIARAVFLALFPSLQDFGAKSYVGKATAVLCVPAILLLNLTLPVVDIEEDDCASIEDKEGLVGEGGVFTASPSRYYYDEDDVDVRGPREGQLVDAGQETAGKVRGSSADREARHAREAVVQQFHSGAVPHREDVDIVSSPWATTPSGTTDAGSDIQRFAIAEGGPEEMAPPDTPTASDGTARPFDHLVKPPDYTVTESVLTRWLTAVQCTLGPVFCVVSLLSDDLKWWYPVVALLIGLLLGGFAYYCFEDHRHPGRVVLCFVGFFVAMVWILMIVNEVVGVLQTIGHIFGLSDAILGLTIFAMGNSLGDLVANATVARMGFPSMAIAACFGGPMLNILLGVGLSGSYLIFTNGGTPLHVPMSRTLVVSGAGLLVVLLSTLVAVPLNGYMMSERMGWSLIAAYVCVLSINIGVEVFL
ncbi:hypothetical protein T439DRAFT_377003 [Meredithblackwellia eburnea MCA 4105]